MIKDTAWLGVAVGKAPNRWIAQLSRREVQKLVALVGSEYEICVGQAE
jgi:hypothetical protein